MKAFTSIVCIPGFWEDADQLWEKIIESSELGYMLIGNLLTHPKTGKSFNVEFCSADTKMLEAFTYAGECTGIGDETLQQIKLHKHVVYISTEGGSLDAARGLAQAGMAVLNAGGIGIKIETAGKAFDKAKWNDLLSGGDDSDLYEMFVVDSISRAEDGAVYTCGMQNLGYKDTIVFNEPFQESVDLLRLFGCYQIVDKPVIDNNQTFSADADAPVYRITDDTNQPYKGDDLFENPFGMWRLSKISS